MSLVPGRTLKTVILWWLGSEVVISSFRDPHIMNSISRPKTPLDSHKNQCLINCIIPPSNSGEAVTLKRENLAMLTKVPCLPTF